MMAINTMLISQVVNAFLNVFSTFSTFSHKNEMKLR